MALPLPGNLLRFLNSDKAGYLPGQTAQIYVTLFNQTGAVFSGSVRVRVKSLYRQIGADLSQTVASLAAGASTTLAFAVAPPAIDFRGYLLEVDVLDGSGAVVDSGVRGLAVESDPAVFPRHAALTAFAAGTDTLGAIQSLNVYCINAVQLYDVLPKHHAPYTAAASWTNLAGSPIDKTAVQGYLANAKSFGMKRWVYNLWHGCYPDFRTDGSGVKLGWGVFTTDQGASAGTGSMDSTPSNPLATPPGPSLFPAGWKTQALLLLDPGNAEWQAYINKAMSLTVQAFDFDGWHIDTLGAPFRPNRRADGSVVDIGKSLVPFSISARIGTGRPIALNNVSRWNAQDVAVGNRGEAVYTELWPADTPNYGDVNTAVSDLLKSTRRGIVCPAYMQTTYAKAHYGQAGFSVSTPGVRYANSVFLSTGAQHLELIDGAPKMATNVFWPGPMLSMPADLQAALQVQYQFLVGYENLLRYGVGEALETASITAGATSSLSAAAGSVWLLPKTKAGFQILHLHNFAGLSSVALHDVNADQPAPPVLAGLAVKMYYVGTVTPATGRLFCASPDDQGGRAQELSYTKGADATGTYITFTLPRLEYWSMVWLATDALSGTDFAVNAGQVVRGCHFHGAVDGVGSYSTVMRGGAGGRWARFERMDFGSGFASLKVLCSALKGAAAELRLDAPDGPLIGTLARPDIAAGFGAFTQATVPVSGAAGVHDLFFVFKDRETAVLSFVCA